jgi:hypothetical protein
MGVDRQPELAAPHVPARRIELLDEQVDVIDIEVRAGQASFGPREDDAGRAGNVMPLAS